MRKRIARLQTQPMHGEPELDTLLADPVMRILWRADHINPAEARQLYAETASKLNERNGGVHPDSGHDPADTNVGNRPGGYAFAMN